MQALYVLGGLYIATQLARKAGDVKKIDYDFSGIEIKKVNPFKNKVEVVVIMTIFNLTSSSVTIDKLSGNLYKSGSFFGFLSVSEPVKVESYKGVDICINTSFKLTTILASIPDFLTNKPKSLRMRGTMKVGVSNIPIDKEIPIKFL